MDTRNFPKRKNNLPTKSSKGLNNFVTGIRGELRGSELNKVRPNLPRDEEEAIQTLILLQKSQEIIIKPCDKGAGIIICDFMKYKNAALEHLSSRISPDSTDTYYKQITERFRGSQK